MGPPVFERAEVLRAYVRRRGVRTVGVDCEELAGRSAGWAREALRAAVMSAARRAATGGKKKEQKKTKEKGGDGVCMEHFGMRMPVRG